MKGYSVHYVSYDPVPEYPMKDSSTSQNRYQQPYKDGERYCETSITEDKRINRPGLFRMEKIRLRRHMVEVYKITNNVEQANMELALYFTAQKKKKKKSPSLNFKSVGD